MEIIIAQVFTQFFILLVQMTLLVVVLVFAFRVSCCQKSMICVFCQVSLTNYIALFPGVHSLPSQHLGHHGAGNFPRSCRYQNIGMTVINFVYVISIIILGMAFGLLLSAICPTENAAVQTAIAVFYPNMLLSGKWSISLMLPRL